jgi:hypothetical protein
MMIWSFERDKRDKEFKRLETQFEEVKKQNEELQVLLLVVYIFVCVIWYTYFTYIRNFFGISHVL